MTDEVRPGGAADAGRYVRTLDRRYVIHSWSTQSRIRPLPVAGGLGARFWDHDGRTYLDFASQVVSANLGYQHPRVVKAIQEQAARLCSAAPSMANAPRSRLAELLAEVSPGDLSMSFFTSGGAEANENALKLARWYTGRQKVVARYRSYHGATAGAASVTGDPRRWPVEPAVPGVVRLLDPYSYRCPAGHAPPPAPGEPQWDCLPAAQAAAQERHAATCPVCAGGPHLEEVLQYEDPASVAAVLLEPVTGANGVIVPSPQYLRRIREVCDRHGILLILDEVMTGFGRTGRWFASEHWGVTPDMMTVAKGITSGCVPLGAMVVSPALADWLQDNYFAGGLTLSGNPLACAAAVATVEAIRDEGVLGQVAATSEVVANGLRQLAARHPCVGDVRGLGLLWGLELVRDRASREPLVPFNARDDAAAPMQRVTDAAMGLGLYLMAHWNVLLVAPPLTITADEVVEGLGLLDRALEVADEACVSR